MKLDIRQCLLFLTLLLPVFSYGNNNFKLNGYLNKEFNSFKVNLYIDRDTDSEILRTSIVDGKFRLILSQKAFMRFVFFIYQKIQSIIHLSFLFPWETLK